MVFSGIHATMSSVKNLRGLTAGKKSKYKRTVEILYEVTIQIKAYPKPMAFNIEVLNFGLAGGNPLLVSFEIVFLVRTLFATFNFNILTNSKLY